MHLCRFNSLRKPSSVLRHLGNMTGARRTRSGSNTPQLPVEQLPRNPLYFGSSGMPSMFPVLLHERT